MANLNFLLQGLKQENDHYAAIEDIFKLPDIEQCLIAVAFLNKAGAEMFASELSGVAASLKFYVGIRNGVTSKQGLEVLLNNGIKPICVDTATQAFIFHPKVYLTQNNQISKVVVGSANFTTGGFVKNIESSIQIELDMKNSNDKKLVKSIVSQFAKLETQYSDNVFALETGINLDEMVQDGLLIDESTVSYRTTSRSTKTSRTEQRPRMKIKTRKLTNTNKSRVHTNTPISIANTNKSITGTINNSLLWKSGPLKRRDLNIPTGPNTHATGSMLLKVGDQSQNIDQRHYFREEVFANASWNFDTRRNATHIERCEIDFRIIIKGVDYGIHTLKLSHNSRTDTATYEQNNSMTQIHWGETVKSLIAHEDLLDSILCIYAPSENSNIYTLSFDDN